ncbi:MAG: type IV secretion system protein TraC [Desulfuromonas thiophila]|nr:type IV secretion system protein TraC [Desulfuromonas thiophila]
MEAKKLKRNYAAELFPHLAFDEENLVFLLEPKSLGFGFICEPLYAIDDSTGDRLNVLLNQDWPVNSVVQFSLWASPDIERYLFEYDLVSQKGTETLHRLRPEAVEYYRRKSSEPLSSQSGLKIRNLQLLITARIPIKNHTPTQKEIDQIGVLRRTVGQSLETGGFTGEPMTAKKLVRIMSVLLNQGKDASWRKHQIEHCDENEVLREQFLDYDTDISVDSMGISLGKDIRVKTLSVKRFPEASVLGVARAFLSETMTGTRGLRENCLITATLIFPDSESARSRLERDKQWVTNQAYGPMLKFAPRLAAQKHSFDALFEALSDGDRVVKLYLGIVLFMPKAQEDASVSNAKTYWRECGYQVMEDHFISLPLFLTNLPFCAEADAAQNLKRYKTFATRHALTQLPVFGSWKGTGTKRMTVFSREGQIMSISPFDSGSSYNAVIAASSGKGKSVTVNDLVLNTLATGGRGWIIDVGRSYFKLCEFVGGQFVEFGADSGICLNPFSVVTNYDEEADMLVGIVSNMAAPNDQLNDYQTSGLRRVMNDVWLKLGTRMVVDDLAEALKAESEPRLRDIGEQLYPFTERGEYGRYFHGENNVNFRNRLAVVELEELKSKKHLQQVVLLQMIFQIQSAIYLDNTELDIEKLVVIDEAWEMLAGGSGDSGSGMRGIAKFIETAYRRFRKRKASCIICTQSLNDLYQSPSGVAIAENSPNKYLLGQNRETVAALQRDKRLDMGGDYGYELLKTVHTIPGHYSEILFLTERGAGVGRLYVDPFKLLLYSTNPDDLAAIQRYTRTGMAQGDAIKAVLKERGQG